MFFTKEKLAKRIDEIQPYMYRHRQPITGWKLMHDATKQIKYPPVVDDTWQDFKPGDLWAGADEYYWFETDFSVPTFADSQRFFLLFDFGMTGLANLGGFESLLFIDGQPYQGVDTFHNATYLKAKAYSGKTIHLAFKAWTGVGLGDDGLKHSAPHKFTCADYGFIDQATYDFYYLSHNLIETIEVLGERHPDVPLYTKMLNHAINLIDFAIDGSEAFYQSIAQANAYLNAEIAKVPKQSEVTVSAIGHTHIDVAWLWRYKHTREKVARSFSTVLRLMDEYPEYVFFHSSPQMYRMIKEDYPEIYAQIKQRVKEGRWEVDGAMWLEPDCNIPSGEALVRQILLGKGFIKQEFNQDSKVLWLPDVFGYSWALPQILKKSGVDTFITTKISWNEFNRMPHDTFMWRGMDGSEVLTHFITTPEPERVGDPSFDKHYTYNGHLQPLVVKGIYDFYQDKEVNQDLLLAYGYGDGGGGVNRIMLENRRQMDRIDGLPWVKPSRLDDYVDRLQETVRTTEGYVQHWDGELYLEFHRGTYTTQAKNKNFNRRMELALRDAEITAVTRNVFDGKAYPADQLHELWITLARNQFHDVIPGSSITEVYQDSTKQYTESLKALAKLITPNVATDGQVSLYNTSGWQQQEWLKLPESLQTSTLLTTTGEPLPFVDLSDGRYVEAQLPATTLKHYQTQLASVETAPAAQVDQVETQYYRVQWNATGQLTSVYDKVAAREVLAGLGNQLETFEDKPLDFNAWNLDIFYDQKQTNLHADKVEVITQNATATEVQFDYAFGQSHLTQVMRLFNDQRRIDFITNVDWHEQQRLLKVAFPVDIRATDATYDIQYGNVKRPTHWNTSWDMAKFETVGHQWADLSEANYGVSLLNNNKYGYDIKDNVMRLSLLRASIWPDPVADQGQHTFTYSLYPHLQAVNESHTQQAAWALNAPFVINSDATGPDRQLFELPGDSKIALDAVKLAEGGNDLIVRMHDYSGGRQTLRLQPKFDYNSVTETDLMETPIAGAVDLEALNFHPYEIKTLRFSR